MTAAVTVDSLAADDYVDLAAGRVRAILARHGCDELTTPARYNSTMVLTAELPLCPLDEDREGWRVFRYSHDGRLMAPFERQRALWSDGDTVIALCPHGGRTRLERCTCGVRFVPDAAVFGHTIEMARATIKDSLPAGWRLVAATGTAEGAVHRDVTALGDGYVSFLEYRRAQRFRVDELFHTG
ncbi:hypothetical protein [Mycobacterium nebraskense]|uniref:hypothetical protein n=1 Tax=Mycobacterium nebraskense TaxID=244292 RepID=UPI000617F27E|nr:hypothetical protein [Mycobacterium nebraskense]KKC04530.1 hypothetical protein WU83_13200 [Mycobacterium nebraskense]